MEVQGEKEEAASIFFRFCPSRPHRLEGAAMFRAGLSGGLGRWVDTHGRTCESSGPGGSSLSAFTL